MKRLLQITMVLVLALALIVGLFQHIAISELATSGSSCRVGWNGRTSNCITLALSSKLPGPIQQVGWNS
jgi:hypothetical protein